MIVVGLTGSVGMGKSTTAAMFADAGVPVYDADAAVHALYAPGGAAVGSVGQAFPGVVKDGAIDRVALRAKLGTDAEQWKRLEAIVHPLARQAQQTFLETARANGARIAVLDIPLLLENGGERRVDKVVVVSAPLDVQRQRVLSRAGMSEAAFLQVLARQMPDAEKRKRADFIVDTSKGLEHARAQVRAILDALGEPS